MKLPKLTRVDRIDGVGSFAGGFREVVIVSGSKEVRLSCKPDTDELQISTAQKKKPESVFSIVDGRFDVIWIWSLTNQQGYSDGFRIELRAKRKSRTFEFIAAASAVEVFEAKKKPNQPLQRNASTGSVSNLESPARRG